MSPSELATLSLLDPEQGVCPDGHPCRFGDPIGRRCCETCDYEGPALICWDIRLDAIDAAALAGATPGVVVWAGTFLADRSRN